MMVRTSLPARTLLPHAVRLRMPDAAVLLTLLAMLTLPAMLITRPALAQTLATPVSFDDRFAAVSEAEQTTEAAAAGAARAAKPDDPPKFGAPLKRGKPSFQPTDSRAHYRTLVEREAAQDGIAPEIAEAVMAVESGYNPDAIGGSGEIGLMQILPSTARMLGFNGTNSDLAVPENNIHYGVLYLSAAWRLAGGDLCTAVMKYRAGHGETRFSFLSVNYCLAVRGKLLARGYPMTGGVPVATFGEAGGSGGGGSGRGCGRKCVGLSRIGTVNIAALNTRLSSLVAQMHVSDRKY
jgi:soluble lytic murein transglycosylase-like protein